MAITSYSNLIAARGAGQLTDLFCHSTTAIGGVTTSWYSAMDQTASGRNGAYSTSANFLAGQSNQGAVVNAATTGAFTIPDCGASYKRYLTSASLQVTSLTGFINAMLVDVLWMGIIDLATANNSTVTPTTVVAPTRYTSTAAAGNQIMVQCVSAL